MTTSDAALIAAICMFAMGFFWAGIILVIIMFAGSDW